MDPVTELNTALAGRYEVEREIARGGMATVYLAHDPRHARRVAIKLMNPALSGAVAGDRFLREIRIAARLTHPHIVPLFDSGEAPLGEYDRVLYYVMPYVEGESLRARMTRERMTPAELHALFGQIASALDYAHRERVVHRDIKPENILLLHGHAVVADFGVARAVAAASDQSTITQLGIIVGTPAYVSPEQAAGGEVDGRADQYSLACVAYELLAERPPFEAANTMGLLMQHVSAPPPPLRGAGGVSEAAEAAIMRALAKDPADRFATVSEFVSALAVVARQPAAARFPAAPTSRAPRVPVPLTALVGREHEIEAIVELLRRDSVRLLTLHGPGGIGKTRVAIGVAERSGAVFADGVFYVSLVDAGDEDALRGRIAHACGVRDARAGGADDPLEDFFHDRSALIVLDNFEQLVEHASVLTALLAAAPRLKALVTSTVLLRVYGEHEYPIEPLSPNPAMRLFLDRARAVRPDLALDDETRAAVGEICRAVDGVPLAIELAAARVRTTAPQQLMPKLRQALDVLSGGARDVPVRQRTMRAAIAWSHDLLDADARMVFRRMSSLVGGGTTDAIAHLCDMPRDAVEPLVVDLVDRSLIREQPGAADERRCTMLRPVAAFAAEVLAQSGEREDVAARHAAYYEALVVESESSIVAGDDARLDGLEAEQGNTSAAIDTLAAAGELQRAVRLVTILWRFWEARGYAREGLERMRSLLDDPRLDVPVKLQLSALYGAGVLADAVGEYTLGRALFERHVALTETLGSPRATAVARNNIGILLLRQGDVDAAIVHLEAAAASVRQHDPRGAAVGLANIGNAERMRKNFGAARARYEEALSVLRAADDRVNVAWTLSHMGDLARDEGDPAMARAHYNESLAFFVEAQHRRGMAAAMTSIGDLSAAQGDVDEARTFLHEGLVHAGESGDVRAMLRVCEVLAGVAAAMGDDARALRLAAVVEAQRAKMGAPLTGADRERLRRRVESSLERLGEASSAEVWRTGAALSIEEAVELAVAGGAVRPD